MSERSPKTPEIVAGDMFAYLEKCNEQNEVRAQRLDRIGFAAAREPCECRRTRPDKCFPCTVLKIVHEANR